MSDTDFDVPKALSGTATWVDDRFHTARGFRVLMRKVFPDHWSFMLGEIALWSFVVLLLTGTFLSLFFVPSMTEVTYHGSYMKLNGIRMSEAYQSTLRISFDVRGGLLIRQIHHWAADLFMAALIIHMLRVFFTGAYRKPREVNWLIGIGLFTLGLLEGLFGYSLPDDQLSGAGLRIFEGTLQGIPIVGTYLAYFLFGGPFPGHDIVPRMYIIHVLLIPAILLALITAHLFFMFHQKHTQMPGKGNTERNVNGQPFYPYFMAKGGAWFFFIFGALVLLSTFAQINPIWLYGPYTPVAISSASQPDFYMGILEGSLRMMPAWEINFLGHTLTMSVLIPFVVPLTIILGGAALWPFFEQWATGDKAWHNVNDRPRNAPVRTATGVAAITFYGVLWAEGANDVIADKLQVPLYTVTWISRVLIFVGQSSPTSSRNVSAWACSVRTGRSCCTATSRASSGSCPTASSSRSTGRWTRRSWRCSRPSRCPRCCPGPAPRTTTACRRPPHAACSARPGRSPTAPSPRPSRSRPTGTATAITGTGTR